MNQMINVYNLQGGNLIIFISVLNLSLFAWPILENAFLADRAGVKDQSSGTAQCRG